MGSPMSTQLFGSRNDSSPETNESSTSKTDIRTSNVHGTSQQALNTSARTATFGITEMSQKHGFDPIWADYIRESKRGRFPKTNSTPNASVTECHSNGQTEYGKNHKSQHTQYQNHSMNRVRENEQTCICASLQSAVQRFWWDLLESAKHPGLNASRQNQRCGCATSIHCAASGRTYTRRSYSTTLPSCTYREKRNSSSLIPTTKFKSMSVTESSQSLPDSHVSSPTTITPSKIFLKLNDE